MKEEMFRVVIDLLFDLSSDGLMAKYVIVVIKCKCRISPAGELAKVLILCLPQTTWNCLLMCHAIHPSIKRFVTRVAIS